MVSSLQWPSLSRAHWLVTAVWYGSLVLALFAVILAFHLSLLIAYYDIHLDRDGAIYNLLKGKATLDKDSRGSQEEDNVEHPGNRAVMFVLQIPILLFSYAVLAFLSGLALLAIQPLWAESGWGNDSKVAMVFLTVLALAASTFSAVSFFVYWKCVPPPQKEAESRMDGSSLDQDSKRKHQHARSSQS